MPLTKIANKVTAKEFTDGPKKFLDGLEDGAPLVITARNRPVAVLVSASDYEYNRERLERYERLITNLEAPEKARKEAHAKVMAELARKGRKV
jgi:prevent-host-death family protein